MGAVLFLLFADTDVGVEATAAAEPEPPPTPPEYSWLVRWSVGLGAIPSTREGDVFSTRRGTPPSVGRARHLLSPMRFRSPTPRAHRTTAPIPSVIQRLPRDEPASYSTFDSLDARSKPIGDAVPLGSAERTEGYSGMPRRSALRVPSPPGQLRPADTRGDPRHARWPLLILCGLATRGRPRKVDIEDLRQFTNDGHPTFDTRVRVVVVP
jgi:hypothetical protein